MEQKLKEREELAVCIRLDRLDEIGIHARLFMMADCANAVPHRVQTQQTLEFLAALGSIR